MMWVLLAIFVVALVVVFALGAQRQTERRPRRGLR